MHRVIKEIKNIFKPSQINEDELHYDNSNIEEHDAFDDHEEEEPQTQKSRIKLNALVDTTELLSALLDSHLKSLDYMNGINRVAVKNLLRQLYNNEKTIEINQNNKDKELDNSAYNLDNKRSDEFMVTTNPLYTPYLLKSLEKEDHPSANEIDKYMRQPEISLKKDPLVC
ncbi:16456_t:CDS:2 [Racocetra fulgida]|uniref:16456_t:CDS:1 n=1 Tax=Racocetra fulgida TaxID=60492 RepID=A0A9N9CNS5_9GLOM|nr:16456_t:CDS:2 [Racocetra fulgida]